MTSRERVNRAIHFKDPDRIPHFLPDEKENDILWLWPGGPEDKQPWKETNGIDQKIDAWGVTWERPQGHAEFGEAKKYAILDITKQADYIFPDCNNDNFLKNMTEVIKTNNENENPKYCLGVMPFSSLNEGTHNIRGLHHMFLDYYEHPEDLKLLLGRLATEQQESIRKLAAAGCNGIMGYDDWGLQDRLMVSLEMIEEFFIPLYRENWKLAHDLGMDVWLHSCGYIIDLLPEFIKAGLDVIQMDQQENMGLNNLSEKVGGKIAFWCPVDVQKTMVDGSINDIQKYTKQMISTLGSHNGGLVSMAYSTPAAVGHLPEKTNAMCEAFRKYEKVKGK